MQKIPLDLELKGNLIDLKPTKEEYYPQLQKILSDAMTMDELKFMAHLEEGGWTLEQIRERHIQWAEQQKKQTLVNFTIHIKASASIGGSCGLKNIDLTNKKAEYGIILHHPFWNTGISLECSLLCLNYGFGHLNLHRITFETSPTNVKAQSLLKKLGAHLECIQKESIFEERKFKNNMVYVIFEQEWTKAKEQLQSH